MGFVPHNNLLGAHGVLAPGDAPDVNVLLEFILVSADPTEATRIVGGLQGSQTPFWHSVAVAHISLLHCLGGEFGSVSSHDAFCPIERKQSSLLH